MGKLNNYVKIKNMAHFVPERIVTNNELAKFMPTSDEWIVAHTGIKTRHYAIDENTSDLSTKVANELLRKSGYDASDIDLIIISTISPDALTPSTAAIVQGNIGAMNAFAFDISAACAGFIFAMSTAEKFLRTGQYQRAIVISAEVNSKMMDFKDRTSAVFFGDGAGGALLEVSNKSADESFIAEKIETNGQKKDVIHSGRIEPLSDISEDNYPTIDAFFQEGRDVFEFATTVVPNQMKQLLKDNKLKTSDIDLVVCHQANLRIIETIADELEMPIEKFATSVIHHGNTSSAGIPMALNEAIQQGFTGGTVLLTGFGAGLAYGSLLIKI
ncbi:beta-ketoacyl-ACP synthase III [Dellaglioa sp. P0083]|uniref:beta-ketoacyl-ACP synthase III n=1 Tax=Dellaglioa kimchii TaxID=3344667 RepID=UPI0038D4A16A